MESRYTKKEFDKTFNRLLADFQYSRKSNVLTYLYYRYLSEQTGIVFDLQNADSGDVSFDETTQTLLVPFPGMLCSDLPELFSHLHITSDAVKTSDIYLRVPAPDNMQAYVQCFSEFCTMELFKNKNQLIETDHALNLFLQQSKKYLISDGNELLLEEYASVTAYIQLPDIADTSEKLKEFNRLCLELKECILNLPTGLHPALTLAEIHQRRERIDSICHQFSNICDEDFAVKHPEQYTWIKKSFAQCNIREVIVTNIESYIKLQQALKDLLTPLGIPSNKSTVCVGDALLPDHDNIFTGVFQRLAGIKHHYFSSMSIDPALPTHIKFEYFGLKDSQARQLLGVIRQHLHWLDITKIESIQLPSVNNGYLTFNIQCTIVKRDLLPAVTRALPDLLADKKLKLLKNYINEQEQSTHEPVDLKLVAVDDTVVVPLDVPVDSPVVVRRNSDPRIFSFKMPDGLHESDDEELSRELKSSY